MTELRIDYRNRQGEPIDLLTWAELYEQPRTLAETSTKRWHLRTVWLGLDADFLPGFDRPRPPRIFGSLLEGDDYPKFGREYGWTTEHHAHLGHIWIVRNLMQKGLSTR